MRRAIHPAAKNPGRAKLALRRRSRGYTLARTRLADSPGSAGYSLGRNRPPAAACSPKFRRPERADASPALPGVRLAAGYSRHCLSRWSIADCGPSGPTPGETQSTLLHSGPSSARRRQPRSDQGKRNLASVASGRHPRSDRGRSTRPRLAPQACPDKVRSGPRVVPIAPHRATEPELTLGRNPAANTPDRNPGKTVARPTAVHSPIASRIADWERIVRWIDRSATIPDCRAAFAARKVSPVPAG